MIAFLLLIAPAPASAPATPPASAPTSPLEKCDATPFTLNKPAPAGKSGSAKGKAQAKAEKPKPLIAPCNDPDHGKPGHKH